ncbi:MAG: hypothetical protein QGI45_06260 [Myxococcota bacterium]|jgi:hypothetical protein|nr:hypothetical protein [Myxococcota bacterium]
MKIKGHERYDLFFEIFSYILIAFVFLKNVFSLTSLKWPYDHDLFRDIAHAQTIADGNFFADPNYLGETFWYNPLVPAIVAWFAELSDLAIPFVYTQAGPWLNLLGPLSFYWLVKKLFGSRAGAFACCAFLFMAPPHQPSWIVASYSPWAFASNVTQSLFYLGLLFLIYFLEKPTWKKACGLGVLLGLTFLGHSAPAILVGSILTIWLISVFKAQKSGADLLNPLEALGYYAVILSTAFILSTPYHISILWNYGLVIKNPQPTAWIDDLFLLNNFSGLLLQHLTFKMGVAFIGMLLFFRRRTQENSASSFIVLSWCISGFALFGMGYFRQVLEQGGIASFTVLPEHHFYFYLHALANIFFGYGIVVCVEHFVKIYPKRLGGERRVLWVYLFLGLILCSATMRHFNEKEDYNRFVDRAQEIGNRIEGKNIYDWLRQNTDPDDVFLTTVGMGLYVIAPAGRKVMVLFDATFSNPYVAHEGRTGDAESIFKAIVDNDKKSFELLATKYGVTHIFVERATSNAINKSRPDFLKLLYEYKSVRVFKNLLTK